MAIDTRKFASVLLAGMLVTAGFVGVIMVSGVAVAVPLGGVGGFTIELDTFEGEDMTMYPTLANTSACSNFPAAVAKVERGNITGMYLYKDLEIPTGDTMRISLQTSEKVRFTGLTQKFTYMHGDFEFDSGQKITQTTSGDISDRFTMSADRIIMRDTKINAQSQFLRTVTLSNLTLRTSLNPTDDVKLGNTECAGPA